MTTMMADYPGLELQYASVESKLKSNYDALVCFIHWNLVNRGLKCIGQGENIPSAPKRSELLPTGWNNSQEEYVLCYMAEGSEDKYMLKCLIMDDVLLVNLMSLKDEKVASLSLDVNQYVQSEHLKDFDKVYEYKELLHELISTDLLATLRPDQSQTSSSSRQRETQPSRQAAQREREGQGREREGVRDPLREPDPLRDTDPLRAPQRLPGHPSRPEWGQQEDPFSVGRGDLDPFGGGGGSGMLMDPFRGGMPHRGIDPGIGMPGRLPRGAVPPGARFDPIGPPRPGGPGGLPEGGFHGGPDPDHLPPPGYDDMFM